MSKWFMEILKDSFLTIHQQFMYTSDAALSGLNTVGFTVRIMCVGGGYKRSATIDAVGNERGNLTSLSCH